MIFLQTMAVFRSVTVFVALLAIVTCCFQGEPEHELPANTCCRSWKDGSRTEPALYSTMGTGPSSHASSVVCYYYKTSKCMVCKSTSYVRSCCTESIFLRGDMPEDEYLILYDTNKGFYDLAPLASNGNSYLSPAVQGWSISSNGFDDTMGVVVNDGSCWENLKDVVDDGSMQYLSLHPNGFLYVVNQ